MSELKAGTIKTPYREGIAFVVDDTFYDKEEGETLFYLKSEADKVFARHKYKRCLAMAEWCEATALWCYQAANTLPIGFRATLNGNPVMIEPRRLFKRSERLNNWVNHWRKLAEKPTWAKFLQLIHKDEK